MRKKESAREPGYRIVFMKLDEVTAELSAGDTLPGGDLTLEEAQAIDELRQIALEIADAEPLQSCTTT
jgi:hypothetical protein